MFPKSDRNKKRDHRKYMKTHRMSSNIGYDVSIFAKRHKQARVAAKKDIKNICAEEILHQKMLATKDFADLQRYINDEAASMWADILDIREEEKYMQQLFDDQLMMDLERERRELDYEYARADYDRYVQLPHGTCTDCI